MTAPEGKAGYPAEMQAPTFTLTAGSGVAVPYCQEGSHVDPSKGCPSTPITQCAILHKLRMYFGPLGFVCEKCGLLFPPERLHHHILSKRHAKDLDITLIGVRKRKIYQAIISHLLTAHGVPEHTTMFDLPEMVPDAIPGLTPTLCYKCPICPTPRWSNWHSMRSHYRNKHKEKKCPDKQAIQPRYIMRPYNLGILGRLGGRSELSNTVILLPEDWTPRHSSSQSLQTAIIRNRPLPPPGAPHLVAIGWPEYLQELKDANISWLMELVAMPAERDLAPFLPKRAALERGLGRVDKFLIRYLKDVNIFLEGCHPSVRRAITAG